jgi:hypothetical protein
MARKKYTPSTSTAGYITGDSAVYDALASDLGLQAGAGTGDRIGAHSVQIGRVIVRLDNGKRRMIKCASAQLEEVLGANGSSSLEGKTVAGGKIESAYLPRRVVYV